MGDGITTCAFENCTNDVAPGKSICLYHIQVCQSKIILNVCHHE